jgi:pyridoxine 5-phosphate synthase
LTARLVSVKHEGLQERPVIRLHVNVDHIATLRNARGTPYPDPVFGAQLCERYGADGITCHLREDRRHIRDADVERLRETLTTLLNLEMAATPEMTGIAERIRPDVITLVPERREERTTEGGLDVVAGRDAIASVAAMCERSAIRLSLFIEASEDQVRASRDLGAQQVEFHTGEFCLASSSAERTRQLGRIAAACRLAADLGLEVAAGHGLTRHNVVDVAAIPEVRELNIGHAIIADAVFFGLEAAIAGFGEAIRRGLGRRSGGSRGG